MAAASSATGASTAHYIAAQNHISSRIHRVPVSYSFPTYFHARKQRRRLLVIRNSGEESGTATEEQSETPVEVPKGPPSLISALNVEKALRGLRMSLSFCFFSLIRFYRRLLINLRFRVAAITDVDHYGRLGLQTGCSYDQVSAAYKSKVAEVMNKELDEEELNKELELLKESHSILSSVEERRLYDWSLARSVKPDRYMWPFEVDITQTPSWGDPPPQEPEDEEPTRLVGYFFLGWLILSFTLLIAFNR